MLAALLVVVPAVAFGAVAWAVSRETLEVVDLTGESPTTKRHARTGKKPLDAVVLHQTGFSRGNDPSRYTKVTAHFVILPDGTTLQLHPLAVKLSSSDGFNDRSVAIEFVGNFQSASGKWWKAAEYGAHVVSAEQLEAGRSLLRMLAKTGIRFVFAHRQSSATRGNDPGPEIWRGVGEWAIRRLDMSDGGPGYAIDDGHPIPDEWRDATVS